MAHLAFRAKRWRFEGLGLNQGCVLSPAPLLGLLQPQARCPQNAKDRSSGEPVITSNPEILEEPSLLEGSVRLGKGLGLPALREAKCPDHLQLYDGTLMAISIAVP